MENLTIPKEKFDLLANYLVKENFTKIDPLGIDISIKRIGHYDTFILEYSSKTSYHRIYRDLKNTKCKKICREVMDLFDTILKQAKEK